MRWLVVLLAVLLSGCMGSPSAAFVPENAELDPDSLTRILIRGALDEEKVFRVRFAAVNTDNEIVPFDGFVKVFLEPQEASQDWIPRFWWGDVEVDGFSKNTPLPYWEYTADGEYLDWGEPVHLRIEATLPDGRMIEGVRDSYA